MPAVVFNCPNTKFKVQHWLPDDEEASDDDYEGVVCHGCARIHFVNRKGEVIGGKDD